MKEYGQRIKEDSEFAERWGDAGPIYGKQWRRWEYYDHDKGMFIEIDQLGKMINGLKKKPTGKNILLIHGIPEILQKCLYLLVMFFIRQLLMKKAN